MSLHVRTAAFRYSIANRAESGDCERHGSPDRVAPGAGGEVHIADYGLQRTPLMRGLFRTIIQNLDGRVNTQPNADGVLPQLMHTAGFRNVEETLVIPTPSGSISLYRGIRAA